MTPSSSSKFRAYLELARISNLPTTFSNVLVGAAAATSVHAEAFDHPQLWMRIGLAWLAIAFLYTAGMAMNDWVDADIDRMERPHRPIPSGRISLESARNFFIALMALALAALGSLGAAPLLAGATLAGIIIIYNFLHARTAASAILLGLARAMVYVIAALAVGEELDWNRLGMLAGALGAYTASFSLVARREMQAHIGRMGWIAELTAFVAILPPFFLETVSWDRIVVPLLLAAMWLSRGVGMALAKPPATRQAVMIWISGICLIDGLYLMILGQPAWWMVASVCFILTTLGQRRVAGT